MKSNNVEGWLTQEILFTSLNASSMNLWIDWSHVNISKSLGLAITMINVCLPALAPSFLECKVHRESCYSRTSSYVRLNPYQGLVGSGVKHSLILFIAYGSCDSSCKNGYSRPLPIWVCDCSHNLDILEQSVVVQRFALVPRKKGSQFKRLAMKKLSFRHKIPGIWKGGENRRCSSRVVHGRLIGSIFVRWKLETAELCMYF